MASKESEALIEAYRRVTSAVAANPQMSLAEIRSMTEHIGDLTAEPGGVDYVEVDAGGVPAMWATPKDGAADRVLLCAHGGGYATLSMYSHRKMYAHYAKRIGCRALIANYGLAPEKPHPVPVNDMARAYRWLLAECVIAPNHIAIAGDSAGGGLAIATMLRARELGAPLPSAALLLSPWVDMELKGGSLSSNRESDALISREFLELMSTLFLGEGGSRQDPLANPLFADLRGLPPIYIHATEIEVLLDDSLRLSEALREADVDVRTDIFPNMQHIFQILGGAAPEADDAIARHAAWVRPRLGL
jgi:epsilon-lactone hydrolase